MTPDFPDRRARKRPDAKSKKTTPDFPDRRARKRPDGNPEITGVGELFDAGPRVVNIGLEHFARDLERRGIPAVHVDWSPPAEGDARRAALLASLDDGSAAGAEV